MRDVLEFWIQCSVRSGHHRHPNTVEVAELLQECIHFLSHFVHHYQHQYEYGVWTIGWTAA